MDKMDVSLWVVGGGLASGFAFMSFMWHSFTNRMDRLERSLNQKIDKVEENLSKRIDKLDEKMTDVDRLLCRLEGAFSSKDCCMLKDDSRIKKAE